VQWLWYSLVASVVLTVVLNLAIRAWPGGAERSAHSLDDWARRQAPPPTATPRPDDDGRRVRMIVPWKAMLLASLVGTVLLNLVLRLF
jgi:hypothetical protein